MMFLPKSKPWLYVALLSCLALFGAVANAAYLWPASGGGAIASNTAPGCSAAGEWTTLTNPLLREDYGGEIGLGNIVLSAPAGFEFNTAAPVTILMDGSGSSGRNINNIPDGASAAVTSITATAITFTVVESSTRRNSLTWQGIQVRPVASSPLASGNIVMTIPSGATGNAGALAEVASTPVCNYPRSCVSVVSGNWSSAATWNCGAGPGDGPPRATDSVTINSQAVALDTDASVTALTVNTGPLQQSGSSTRTLAVSGNLVSSGTVADNGASGSLDLTVGGNLTANGSTFTVDNLSVAGNTTNNTAFAVSGSFNVGGDLTANDISFSVGNLVFQKAGTQAATFNGTASVVTNLTVNSGSTVSSTNYSTLNLKGALTNNGTINLPNTTWVFSGTSPQTIGGSGDSTLGAMVMNNASGLTLTRNVTVPKTLTLTRGVIDAGAFSVSATGNCPGSVSGSAASYVNGKLRLFGPAYAASCVFHVGDANNYAPITFDYPWHAAPLGGLITGSTVAGDHPDTSAWISGIIAAKSVNRYWVLTKDTAANFYTYEATFQFCNASGGAGCAVNDVDAAADPSQFIVAEKVGSSWSTKASTAPTTTSRKATGLTGFGDFAIGDPGTGGDCPAIDFASASWNFGGSGYTPQVVNPPAVPSSRLRLTDKGTQRSTFAQLKKWFPAAGNKVVVTFDYYVWGGNGADGMAVVFSDADVAASAGAYGGSLGYAQKTGASGFAGGWLAVGLDEFGNFSGTGEGRQGYPSGWTAPTGANATAVSRANNISVRGSGSGTTGYALLANTGTLSPSIWSSSNTSSTVRRFEITIDHSNSVNAYVTVKRDTGSGYSTVVPRFDAKGPNSGQAAVPKNWLLSFTGSTGDNVNYHEIANLSVCATYVVPPGGSVVADSFACVETGTVTPWDATARKPLYTKLVGQGFKFDVVALKSDGKIEDGFVASGSEPKSVTVALFDDSVSPAPASCSAYDNPVATPQTLSFASSDGGRKTLTSDFTVGSAYRKLRCRVTDATVPSTPVYGCSTDQFAVRPSAATLVTAQMAPAPSASATPTVTAGSAFKLSATTSASSSYSERLGLDTSKLTAQDPGQATQQSGDVVGTLTTPQPTPSSLTANAAAVDATYSEVGYLYLAPGAYRDEAFTAVDRSTGDCISDTTSDNNLADTPIGGKYGCDIGNRTAVTFGRFIPHHFVVTPGALLNRRLASCNPASAFTYAGEEMQLQNFKLTAYNGLASPGITRNYSGLFAARFDGNTIANFNFGAVDLADSTAPVGTTSFGVGDEAGKLGLVSSSGSWGSGSEAGGIGTFTANVKLNRADSPDGPYESFRLGIAPVDLDLVTVLPADKNLDLTSPADGVFDKVLIGSTHVRFGRLRLDNAYGSERLYLKVPMWAEYWTGQGFAINEQDSCTSIASSRLGLGTYNAPLSPTNFGLDRLPAGPLTLTKGAGSVTLSPGNVSGSVFLGVNLSATTTETTCAGPLSLGAAATSPDLSFLRGGWCGTGYGADPRAKLTFGVYRSLRKLIHRREVF